MTGRRRIESPRIVEQPNYVLRGFVVVLALAAIGARERRGLRRRDSGRARGIRAFGRGKCTPSSKNGDRLAAQVVELKQQSVVLERSQQIDREANRRASKQLMAAQDERLALEKEVSFLRRLIQEGGGGILQPKDFSLKETGELTGEFGYSFTIRQLIQDFGESTGSVDIQIVGKRDGEDATLPLAKLEGSEPASHKMKFKHFQSFEGTIRVPDAFEPESFVVEIEPTTTKLIPVSETFPWTVDR